MTKPMGRQLPSVPIVARTGRDEGEALRIGDVAFSERDLLAAATSVAERIRGARRVAVWAEPTAETVLAVLGCLIGGVTVVPVPPDSGRAELRHIVADSGVQAWLGPAPAATPETADGAQDGTPVLPVIPVRRHARSYHVLPQPQPDSAAMIVYTSGTTGAPKGVVLSHRAIAADLDALADAWAWTAQDVLVHGLPLFHVHGLVLGILGPLRRGGRVVHTVRPDPKAYAAAAGTMYFGVPTVWSRIVADPESADALRGARLLISGSAPLPISVFEGLRALTGHAPVERYGMTESLITVSTRADGERRPGWVGLPVVGVQTRLRDEHGGEVPADGESIGRLQVRGATLFDGYLNNPEATAKAVTSDGWLDTGDVAVIDAGGFHKIVGRESTDLIKSGGYRVGAGEVETALLRHPGVAEAAVVGLPDEDLGQRIVAFVVRGDGAADGAALSDAGTELIEFVADELSAHKRPREIRMVTALPRNAMGKVQKALLG